jgi:hypothetical protein
VGGRSRAAIGAALVLALAVAGTATNLFLLRLTQDSSDPVGRLSPRAVFTTPATTTPPPAPPPPVTTVTTTTAEHRHGADD